MNPPLDVVVFGATGFTGRLVAEHLQATYGGAGGLRWGLAGRDTGRLAEVRQAIGAAATLPLLAADARQPGDMAQLARQARVVISTVGPYQRHGQALVDACAANGTDYVDLCGEPLWMAQMIPRLQPPAAASGARIVFSCGFDSIPFDLGVVFLQDEMMRRFGAPAAEVRARVRRLRGGLSGGTVASALATVEQAAGNPALAALMDNPFALTPGFTGPPQPDGQLASFDDWAGAWCGPFVMAPINTKNVHRTNALRGHPWGTGFCYDERQQTGAGPRGEKAAKALALQTRVQARLLRLRPARTLLQRLVLPKPGQGPGPKARERGLYEVAFTGCSAQGQRLTAVVTGDRDPGYGSTCKLISESALCLLHDVPRSATPGGVWTPGAAMGLALARRLQARAGLQFAFEGDTANA